MEATVVRQALKERALSMPTRPSSPSSYLIQIQLGDVSPRHQKRLKGVLLALYVQYARRHCLCSVRGS